FAIWFFLGIEGLANAAEESHHPQRDLTRGFASAMLTLVLLCGLTFVGAVGVAGWEAAVLKPDGTASDSPLPLVLSGLVGADSGWYYAIIVFGVFGLVASFHGLLMAAGRATFELGRGGYFSTWLGRVHSRFQTPTNALIINMLLGIGALLTNTTADIIVLSVLGALTLYIFGALSVWQLRRREPHLPRPFRTPVYGLVVSCTFVLAAGALLVVSYLNGQLAIYYLVGLLAAFLFVKINQYFFQN
ncbi:MAG: amino acid permease, partial [Runella slithyformis]